MNEELKEIRADVKRLLDMNKRDHEILESIQRRARLSVFMHAAKWIIIVGISIGAFIFVQPALEKITSAYDTITGVTSGDKGGFLDFFNPFK